MEKEFVTYEIALAMKELEFIEPCLGWYDKDKKFHLLYTNVFPNGAINQKDIYPRVPLWQQVIDWFREEHDIHISIDPLYRPQKFGKLMYCFNISYKDNFYGGMNDNLDAWLGLSEDGVNYHICENYNKAREQAILQAIKLIKNENIVSDFVNKLINNSIDLDSDISRIVDENFEDLI